MKEMIKKMVQEMVAQSIAEVMSEMMGTTSTPQVANAEVVKPTQHSMSVEDFLALAQEEPETPVLTGVAFEVVDFKPRRARTYRKAVKYNKFIPSAVWTYNHLQIRANYPAIKYSEGHYYADSLSDFATFASQFHITEKLSEEQMAEVKKYWDSKKNK